MVYTHNCLCNSTLCQTVMIQNLKIYELLCGLWSIVTFQNTFSSWSTQSQADEKPQRCDETSLLFTQA